MNNGNVIIQYKNIALIDRGIEYVVAIGYDVNAPENQQWKHGIYFTHWGNEIEKLRMLSKAAECFRVKTDDEYISRSRLEELATDSLHALLEDDEETAMEFFENEIELTPFEYEYFGIKTESEEE